MALTYANIVLPYVYFYYNLLFLSLRLCILLLLSAEVLFIITYKVLAFNFLGLFVVLMDCSFGILINDM